ncbi:MAG: S8 family serine peptidase [Candidatus Uhrbacteria bacterium]
MSSRHLLVWIMIFALSAQLIPAYVYAQVLEQTAVSSDIAVESVTESAIVAEQPVTDASVEPAEITDDAVETPQTTPVNAVNDDQAQTDNTAVEEASAEDVVNNDTRKDTAPSEDAVVVVLDTTNEGAAQEDASEDAINTVELIPTTEEATVQTDIHEQSEESTDVFETEEAAGSPNVDELVAENGSTPSETPRRGELLTQKLNDLQAQQNVAADKAEGPYVPGEVLVKFKTKQLDLTTEAGKTAVRAFADAQRLDLDSTIAASNIAVLRTRDGETVPDVIARLRWIPEVLHAQPNFRYQSLATNDKNYQLLWALENTGQLVSGPSGSIVGTLDADIDALEAWTKNEGDEVIVAVIDSGVAFNHPDLQANMWDGTNCKDENGATLGGCQHGFNFTGVGDEKIPLPTDSSHGTHISGTIAAVGNNNLGTIGVAPKAKIMALKVDLSTQEIVDAIVFAGANGAKIINASWGGKNINGVGGALSADDLLLKRAIDDFPGTFVAAAGNGKEFGDPNVGDVHGQDIDLYPCDFDSANIICVAATDQNDGLAAWSDYGHTSVDVGAPGTNILSTIADSNVVSENFNGVTTPSLPSGWTKTGDWGTYDYSGDKVLYGDVSHAPYADNADSVVTLPSVNLNGTAITGGIMSFYSQCDTELDSSLLNDYMALEVSDDGVNWPIAGNLGRWNEASASLTYDDVAFGTTSILFHFSQPIPSQFLTSNFTARFRWHTNSSVASYDGCWIDDITLTTLDDGSSEQYTFEEGTSMAAPHVAGVAALVKGYNPNVTSSQVKQIVLKTGDALASLAEKTVSGKRINAANALAIFDPHVGLTTEDVLVAGGHSLEGEVVKFNFRVKDGNGVTGLHLPFTLKQFEYSTDGGADGTWRAPTNGDASEALGSFLSTGRTTDDDFTGESAFAIMFNANHADLTGLRGDDQNDVRIRFKANDGALNSPFAVSDAFSVDLLAPTATLSGTPSATTNATSATITVGGTDAVLYQYSLNGSDFSPTTPIATPLEILGLTEGNHTLRVIATDDVGNVQAEADATTFTWTVDTTAGTALLTSKPDVRTNMTTATFVVGGEDVAQYFYKLDSGEAQGPFDVNDAIALTELAEGEHTIGVMGIDALGNMQNGPTMYTWIIDTTPETATISGAPSSPTKTTNATFTIGGTDIVAYKYALDAGAFGPETLITTPITLTDLADGEHTLKVIARDSTGNWAPEVNATFFMWTVDTIAPSLVEVTPVATPTNDSTPSLAIQVENRAAWEVLRGETVLASGTGTGEAQTVTLPELTDGIYTLTLAATDAAGNRATITLEPFVIDTASPTGISLDGIPTNPTNVTSATITLNAGSDVVSYRASVDDSDYGAETPITTPITLTDLADGTHELRVIGKDTAGNWQPEAAASTAQWTVDTIAPIATLAGTAGPTPSNRAHFTVGGDGVVAYRYVLDAPESLSAEILVADPIVLTNLSDGQHGVAVIGRDAAGNWQTFEDQNVAKLEWTVDSSLAVAPIANPTDTMFIGTIRVTFTAPGADLIRYAVNSSSDPTCAAPSPTELSILPGASLPFVVTTTIRVIACYGTTPSLVASFTYTRDTSGDGWGNSGGGGSATSVYSSTAPIAAVLAPTIATTVSRVLGTRVFADGLLLRVDKKSIYVVHGRTLHKIVNLDILRRFAHQERINVAADDIAGYTIGSPVPTTPPIRAVRTLLRVNKRDIYVTQGLTIRRIASPRALWPYRAYSRIEVTDGALVEYTEGEPVE